MQYKGFKMMKRAAAVIVSAAIMLADIQGVSAAGVEQTFTAETMENDASEDSAQAVTDERQSADEGLPAAKPDTETQNAEVVETVQTETVEAVQTEIIEAETTQAVSAETMEGESTQDTADETKTEESGQIASETEEMTDASEVAANEENVKTEGNEIKFRYDSEDNKELITDPFISVSVNDPITIEAITDGLLPAGASSPNIRWASSNPNYVNVTERADVVGKNAAWIEGLKPTADLEPDSKNGVVSVTCILTYRDDKNELIMLSGIINVRVKPLAESITVKVGTDIATGKIAVYDIGENEFIAIDNRKLSKTEPSTKVECLSASVLPLDANQKLTWTSSNTSIIRFVQGEGCEVTENGAKAVSSDNKVNVKVESSGAGEAVITVAATDGSKVVGTVTVRARRVITKLTFTPKPIDKDGKVFYDAENKTLKIAEGTSIYLEPEYEPIDATVKKINWKCSNTGALDLLVNESTNVLKVTAKDGTGDTRVTLTATATDMSEETWDATIEIRPRVKKLEIYNKEDQFYENCLNGKSIGIDPEGTIKPFQLIAKNYPEDSISTVQWKISNEKIATIDADTGEVTVLPDVKGTAVITATAIDGSKTTASVTLNVATLASSVSIEGSQTVMKGKTIKLTATIQPPSVANAKVKWKSLMPDIAGINESTGVVTGKKQGIAIIIATVNDGSGVSSKHHTIQVTDPPEKFDIVDSENNIISGKTVGIDPDPPKPAEGGVAVPKKTLAMKILPDTACQKVEWKSSNEKVAAIAVNEKGVPEITAKAIGKATITAEATDGSGKKASIVVNVNTLARGMTITGNHYLAKEMTLQLKAEITNKDAASKSVIWKSNAPKIAEVDETGLVTAVGKDGTAVITAEAVDGSGVTATHNVHVVNGKSKVEIISSNRDPIVTEKKKKTMTIDLSGYKTIEFDLRATLSGYSQRNEPFDIKWSTSSKSIAAVETDKANPEIGHVTVYKGGTVKITATSAEGYESFETVTITVKNDNPLVTITGSGHRLARGKKMKLSTGGVAVTWESSDDSIATVNKSGQVTADRYDNGLVTITARAVDGSYSDTYDIEIGDPTKDVSLTLNGVPIEDTKKKIGVDIVNGCEYNSYKNSEMTLGAILNFDEDLSQAAGENITWKSSNKGVAVIDENGRIELKKKGNVTFTATATDGSNKKAKVTFVVSKQVKQMDPAVGFDGEIRVGLKKSIQLSSAIEYRPLAATKPKLIWTIEDDSDAVRVGKNNGKVTGLIEDETVRIRATDANNPEVTCVFTVYVGTPVNKVEVVKEGVEYRGAAGIDLGVSNPEPIKLRANLYAKGDEDDIPTLGYNVTKDVLWSSSNSAIASVDDEGVVTAHKKGEVTITATATDGSNKKGKIKVYCGKLVSSITLSETIVGGSIELDLAKKNKKVVDLSTKLKVSPVTAENRKLTYKSEDKTVATVSSSGKVTAKGEGFTNIIVTSKDGNCSERIPVSVYDSSY